MKCYRKCLLMITNVRKCMSFNFEPDWISNQYFSDGKKAYANIFRDISIELTAMRIQRKRFSLSLGRLPNTKATVLFSFSFELRPLDRIPLGIDWIRRPCLIKNFPAPLVIWRLTNKYDAFNVSSTTSAHGSWAGFARRNDATWLPRHRHTTFTIKFMVIGFYLLSWDTLNLNISCTRNSSFFKLLVSYVW